MSRTICESLSSFLVMDVLEKAQAKEHEGHDIIHLEIGQPDFATPSCIKAAALEAVRANKTAYTHSMGIRPLREAVASYYKREYGVWVSPEQVMITSGTSPAMLLLFSMLCQKGDNVIVTDPAYACYESFIRFAGADVIRVSAPEENGFQPDPDLLRRAVTENTRAIIINSPSNPAGSLLSREALQEIASIGPLLVSDEIYHGLVYEGRAVSALEVTSNCAVLDGFSKRYAMTGWRLGWLVAPARCIPTLQAMQQRFFISPNSISQWAGLAALSKAAEDVRRMAARYNERRLYLVSRLRELGFGVRYNPAGAFYVLADARHLTSPGGRHDSLHLAMDILDKAGVGVAPGIDFGPGAEGYLRFSYANSLQNITRAMVRLERYLRDWH